MRTQVEFMAVGNKKKSTGKNTADRGAPTTRMQHKDN